MYFVNEQHKENYEFLMNLYKLQRNKQVDYEASIYIAAYPPVFKCYDKSKISPKYGPLVYLFKEKSPHNPGALYGSTRALAKAGSSLHNGKTVNLSSVMDDVDEEMFEIFVQACKIRGQFN